MAFEALVDYDTKVAALKTLVENGTLTKHDFDLCIKALTRKATEKGLVYRDKYISVLYKGIEEINSYGGKGLKVLLIIENRTKETITVRARKSINGIICGMREYLASDIPEKSKVIASTTYFYNELKAADIYNLEDINDISLLFWCENSSNREINKAKKPVVINFDKNIV